MPHIFNQRSLAGSTSDQCTHFDKNDKNEPATWVHAGKQRINCLDVMLVNTVGMGDVKTAKVREMEEILERGHSALMAELE